MDCTQRPRSTVELPFAAERAWNPREREMGLDYLIIGLTSGSLFAIAGFFLREIGLRPSSSLPSWSASLGNALMVVGVFIWGVTGAVALADMDDGTGRTMVLVATVLGLVGAVVATFVLARHQAPPAVKSGEIVTTEFPPDLSWSPPVPEVSVPEPTSDVAAHATETRSIDDDDQAARIPDEERSSDFWLKTWLQPGDQVAAANSTGSPEANTDQWIERASGVETDVPAVEAGFWAEDVPLGTTPSPVVTTTETPDWISALDTGPVEPVALDENASALDPTHQT